MQTEDLPKENYEFNITLQSKCILQVFRESLRETSSLTPQATQ